MLRRNGSLSARHPQSTDHHVPLGHEGVSVHGLWSRGCDLLQAVSRSSADLTRSCVGECLARQSSTPAPFILSPKIATIAKREPACTTCSERALGPLTDAPRFIFRNSGKNGDGQMVCIWHVAAHELDARCLELVQEVGVARQAIQLRDYQARAIEPAGF